MKPCWNQWAIRATAIAVLVLCNFLIGCDCGGGGNGAAPVGGTMQYAIVDLGTMNPTGINNNSQIVGNIFTAGNTTQPVFWQSGTITQLQSLNGPSDFANAINDAGQIVGHAGGTSSIDPTFHAVIWASSKAAPAALPVPAGTTDCFSDATALNSNGDVVGFGQDTRSHGIAWPHGTSTGVILLGPSGSTETALWSVNASQQAVGASYFPSPTDILRKLVLFNVSQPGVGQDLGVELEEASTIHTISVDIPSYITASGTIVGSMGTAGGGFAFVRQSNGQVTQITSSPDQSAATGINATGTVILDINPDSVGQTPTCATYDTVNGLRDLNTLVPSGSGWQLQFASGINDNGRIVGSGQFQGSTHGFLLTPVPSGT